ncbi:hypothetical protein, partial [Bifidobacterium longum]|uniref:hypothetical protein n=1 Tax=Bifidobacterium longum TaxID=216816 RepID=UPI0029904F7F
NAIAGSTPLFFSYSVASAPNFEQPPTLVLLICRRSAKVWHGTDDHALQYRCRANLCTANDAKPLFTVV